MICERCGIRHATTHIARTVNGVLKEYNLCPVCAAQVGFSSFNPFDLSNFFGSLLEEEPVKNTKKCKKCGSTFDEIVNSGRIGCAECYNTFKEDIAPSILKIHGNVKHIGDSPKNDVAKPISEIDKLKRELNTAIEKEDFENAAKLRDKIKEIEKGA